MILGEDQLNALTSLKYFLNSSNPAISLIGYAGTGKTTVIKYFLEFLDNIKKPYVLCAPTHKAKIVLENMTLVMLKKMGYLLLHQIRFIF